MLACANPPAERRPKPHPNQVLKCPRCESLDTKFCYYNNYSTTQPRYFCKNCKRYWTEGGALRNVPVGGGLRKNKRSKQRTSSMPLSSSSPGQHARSSPFAFEGLHLPASHTEDLASSFTGSPTGSTEITAFRYLNGQSADPNGYESCMYKAGDQPSSQNQFNYNDVRHFPQYYTGYGYNSAMRNLNQNDIEGYSHLGPGRSDQSLPSCARGSGAIIDPDHGSYKGLRITSELISSSGLHGHRLHEQGEHRHGVIGGNGGDGMAMGYFYEHKRPSSEEVMLNEEDQLQPSSNELMLLQDSTTREAREGGGSQEGVNNAMNVSYPYDWQQISEGLFGGTADFYYMQAGGSGVGGASGGGSEAAAAAVGASTNWTEFNVGAA